MAGPDKIVYIATPVRRRSMTMQQPISATVESLDPIWKQLRSEAEQVVAREPALAGLVYTYVLNHERLEGAVAHRIADRLDSHTLDGGVISRAFADLCEADRDFPLKLRADLVAIYARDPACTRFIEPVL